MCFYICLLIYFYLCVIFCHSYISESIPSLASGQDDVARLHFQLSRHLHPSKDFSDNQDLSGAVAGTETGTGSTPGATERGRSRDSGPTHHKGGHRARARSLPAGVLSSSAVADRRPVVTLHDFCDLVGIPVTVNHRDEIGTCARFCFM